NKKYRSLVLQRKAEYTRTSKRSEKNDIAKWLYDKITLEHKGRFVKTKELPDETKFLVVEKSVAMEKIRQSMRQALNRPKPSSSPEKNGPGAPPNGGTAESQGKVQAWTAAPFNSGTVAQFGNVLAWTAAPFNIGTVAQASSVLESHRRPPKKSQARHPQPSPEDLQRYKLTLSYDGTRFSGSQRQSSSSSMQDKSPANMAGALGEPRPTNIRNLKKRKHDELGRVKPIPVTVQESLEDALEMYSSLDRPALRMRVAGRTDAGVHARGQVVAVSLPKPGNKSNPTQDTELWQIRRAINSRLPVDISVDFIELCQESFDPRNDVVSKQYSYTLRYRQKTRNGNSESLKISEKGGPQLLRQAFDPSCLWIVPWSLDDSKMEQYCKLLCGDRDYSPFVHKEARDGRNNRKPITRFSCVRTKAALPDDGVYD
ncbi:MAG: hypothetical protein SGILL_009823, partial [Bacillariaceae sp.]